MTKLQHGLVERNQAALEAVKLLEEAGFVIENYDFDGEPQDTGFSLDLEMHIEEHERPLAILG